MKLVIDTNVFISGIFFSGPPHQILRAWRDGKIRLMLTEEILTEYKETSAELSQKYPSVDLSPWMELVSVYAVRVTAQSLAAQVCTDPDDDMFLACAIASGAKVVVSGDKALLETSGYEGIKVCSPRDFVDDYVVSQ